MLLKIFRPYHKNQKGEGEGSLIIVVLVICAIISAIFWFLKFIKDSKHNRIERVKKAKLEEMIKKRQLVEEKHEPRGYVYYYRPGINTKCKNQASVFTCLKCKVYKVTDAVHLTKSDKEDCFKCENQSDKCEIEPYLITRPKFG